jgi:hypothetical protein
MKPLSNILEVDAKRDEKFQPFRLPEKFESAEMFSSLTCLILVLRHLCHSSIEKIEEETKREEILTGKRILPKICMDFVFKIKKKCEKKEQDGQN